jgi:hypothetical protein
MTHSPQNRLFSKLKHGYIIQLTLIVSNSVDSTHVLTGKFDLANANNMAFYILGPKLLIETTEISTHPNSTQQDAIKVGSGHVFA